MIMMVRKTRMSIILLCSVLLISSCASDEQSVLTKLEFKLLDTKK